MLHADIIMNDDYVICAKSLEVSVRPVWFDRIELFVRVKFEISIIVFLKIKKKSDPQLGEGGVFLGPKWLSNPCVC